MGRRMTTDEAAALLRDGIPQSPVDEAFVSALASAAAASTSTLDARPAPARRRHGLRVAAVVATLAMTSVGAAYAVDRLGGTSGPGPVQDPGRSGVTDSGGGADNAPDTSNGHDAGGSGPGTSPSDDGSSHASGGS